MKEPPGEISRVPLHDDPLPFSELDPASVLPPGPMLRNKHGQCFEVLLTSVMPILWTPNTLDIGMTADIALCAAASRPRQSSQHAMFSAKTSFRPRVSHPSPRYRPRRYEYAGSSSGLPVQRGQSALRTLRAPRRVPVRHFRMVPIGTPVISATSRSSTSTWDRRRAVSTVICGCIEPWSQAPLTFSIKTDVLR